MFHEDDSNSVQRSLQSGSEQLSSDPLSATLLSQANISYLTDAVVALRYAEVEGRLHKFMSVVKVRGSDHSRDVRGYEITENGIEVDELPTGVEGTLTGGAVSRAPGR